MVSRLLFPPPPPATPFPHISASISKYRAYSPSLRYEPSLRSRSFGTTLRDKPSPLFSHSCTIRYRIAPLESHSYAKPGGWGEGLWKYPRLLVGLGLRVSSFQFRVSAFHIGFRLSTFDSSTSRAQLCNPTRMNTYKKSAGGGCACQPANASATASATRAICSGRSSGYIGRESTSRAACSAAGKSPGLSPSEAYTGWKGSGTG